MHKNVEKRKLTIFSFFMWQYRSVRWLVGLRLKRNFARQDDWVFSRTACLGNDSFALLQEYSSIFRMNLQKGRTDLLLAMPSSSEKKHNSSILKFIVRDDIVPHIWAQFCQQFADMPKPKFILMDSYSDLTDLKFFDKSKSKSFYCHKSDLTRTIETQDRLLNLGLLPLNELESLYTRLFDDFRLLWGNVIIIFIHFPTKLETRDLYLKRAKEIETAIERLSNRELWLYSIRIPDHLVWPETLPGGATSTFPYHYSVESKLYVASEIRRIMQGR